MNTKKKHSYFGRAVSATAHTTIIAMATIGGVTLIGSSVFASLNATAFNAAGTVATDTLKLTQTASAVTGITGGLSTAISGMAPGDVVNRFVDLKNTGTMDGTGLTLQLADSASTTLTSNASIGLQVSIAECSSAWTGAGLCPGGSTQTVVLASTPASTLVSTPTALSVSSLAAASTNRLRITMSLPAGSETTVNGVLPGTTVQGVTSSLVWTFTEAQRLATTTSN